MCNSIDGDFGLEGERIYYIGKSPNRLVQLGRARLVLARLGITQYSWPGGAPARSGPEQRPCCPLFPSIPIAVKYNQLWCLLSYGVMLYLYETEAHGFHYCTPWRRTGKVPLYRIRSNRVI